MNRKRLTQLFPFLLPFRKWQRKICFYLKMRFDRNRYARGYSSPLTQKVFQCRQVVINPNSGYGIQYQQNKAHNLKIASRCLNGLVIAPGETFSFWQAVRKADKKDKYLDALCLVYNEIQPIYGGGLCQLSNLLYWCFLHTPLTVVERHAHSVESLPPVPGSIPEGLDATVSEGWKDLKVRNDTGDSYQILVDFDETDIMMSIYSDIAPKVHYDLYEKHAHYDRQGQDIYRENEIWRREYFVDGRVEEHLFLKNRYRITYAIAQEALEEDIL